MSRNVSDLFSNLAAPDPDEGDFSNLHSMIIDVLRVPEDELFNFGTDMISDMADTIVTDLLDLDEDQEQMFRETFSEIMQKINKQFQTIINNKIAFDNTFLSINDFGWRKISDHLNQAIYDASIKITYAAMTIEYVEPEEPEFTPLDFLNDHMEWGEVELQEDLFQLMEPKFHIHDDEVLEFIRHKDFVEDILEDADEYVRRLGIYTPQQANKIIGTARISLHKVQELFKEEYGAYLSAAKGEPAIAPSKVAEWGKCIRNTINGVVTNVTLAMIAVRHDKIDVSRLDQWAEPEMKI